MEAEDERNRLRLDHSTVDVAFQNILLSMFGFRDRMEKEICLARREVGRFTCVCVCVYSVYLSSTSLPSPQIHTFTFWYIYLQTSSHSCISTPHSLNVTWTITKKRLLLILVWPRSDPNSSPIPERTASPKPHPHKNTCTSNRATHRHTQACIQTSCRQLQDPWKPGLLLLLGLWTPGDSVSNHTLLRGI